MWRRLIHTVLQIPFISSAIHPSPPIVKRKQEMGLVTENNVAPVVGKGPLNALPGPLQPGMAMAVGEDIALDGPEGAKSSCMQAVPDGLVRDATCTRQCPGCHSGCLETIPEMCDPDVAVLGLCSDPRSA